MASATHSPHEVVSRMSSLDGKLSSLEPPRIVILPDKPGDEDCNGDWSSYCPVDPKIVRNVGITGFRTSAAIKVEEGHSENGLSKQVSFD